MFTVLDGILIALTLICVFLGARRGFIGSVVRLFGGFVRLILSILLAKPAVKLVSLITKLDEHMFNKYANYASGISDKFNVNLVGLSEEELNNVVTDALSDAKIPKLFRGLFNNVFSINPETIAHHESVTLAEMMGVTITNIILLICSFVVIFLLLWLVGFLCKKWSIKISSSTTLFARTNKWLGALFGFVKAIVISFVIFFVIALFENVGIFKTLTDFINGSVIVGPVYRFAKMIFDSSFDLTKALESYFISK